MEGMPFVPEVEQVIQGVLEDARREHGGDDAGEAGRAKVESELFAKIRDAKVKFTADLKMLYDFMRDPAAPAQAKLVAIGALLYFILPVDLVPDVIPVLGYVDDAAVVTAAVSYLRTQLGKYRGPARGRRTRRARA